MSDAEDLDLFVDLLPEDLLARLKAAPLDDAFMIIQTARPELSLLSAIKTLTAFQLYRTSNAFKERVDAHHAALKNPVKLPTRLPDSVVDSVARVFRTAAADLICGNLRVLETDIIKAYAMDDPSRTLRCDRLDALYEERLGKSDLVGALIVDQVRCGKLEPPRCVAARAAELLDEASVVVGRDASGNQWVASVGHADDYALLISVPGQDSVVLDDATMVTENGGWFYIGPYRFKGFHA